MDWVDWRKVESESVRLLSTLQSIKYNAKISCIMIISATKINLYDGWGGSDFFTWEIAAVIVSVAPEGLGDTSPALALELVSPIHNFIIKKNSLINN